MKKVLTTLILALAACAVDSTPPATTSNMLYTCYTHATCDGVRTDTQHRVCTTPSDNDVNAPGDVEADAWATSWRTTCNLGEGLATDGTAHVCYGTYGRAPWGCDVTCEPEYEPCQ